MKAFCLIYCLFTHWLAHAHLVLIFGLLQLLHLLLKLDVEDLLLAAHLEVLLNLLCENQIVLLDDLFDVLVLPQDLAALLRELRVAHPRIRVRSRKNSRGRKNCASPRLSLVLFLSVPASALLRRVFSAHSRFF